MAHYDIRKAYPTGDDLLGFLKHRRPFTAGVHKPLFTGALGTAYPRNESGRLRTFEPDNLQRAILSAYAAALEVDPQTYTLRTFDDLLGWYDGRRWNISTARMGRLGSAHRNAVQSALLRLDLGYHPLRFDTHES